MIGEIGTFDDGGFYDWNIETQIINGKAFVRATAQSYWIFKRIHGEVVAKFYALINSELVLMNEVKVKLYLDGDLNKRIYFPLVMTWTS
jgi:hypothetical protein